MADYFQHIKFTAQGVTHLTFTIGEKARLSHLARNRPCLYALCGLSFIVEDLTEGPLTCIECIIRRETESGEA